MNEQRLEMKYHPAKKEVFFRRIISNEDGKEAEEEVGSGLTKYMETTEDGRGNFVLQNQGEKFFKDIADVFDGEAARVDVITTRLDYEDFEQMLEHYNKNIEITATLLAELPDMDTIYREVKKHGEKSIGILEKHLGAIRDIPRNDERVRGCVDDFAKIINTEKSSIHDKMGKMTNDHINLCFAGVYSAGKSSLINAILGYQILPEAMESTTAKMFRIESPHPGNPVRIDFDIKQDAIVSWDEKSGCFVFGAGPNKENATRRAIQGIIDANKSAERHDQMLKILEALKSRDDIDADIKVYFPVPLDSERVQFAIYDTPETDSNVEEHQIESPKPGNPVHIDFDIQQGAILSWDETSGCFIFGAGPTEENATRMAIQRIIDANRGEEQHRQVYKILEALNSRNDIDADIKVYFPVPLDSERVQFVIYDTPGTDSNVVEHQGVLQGALSEQTHSILVFVVAPGKLEGEGNSALLSCLKVAEKQENICIDLGRSLFVINFADRLDKPQEREAYQEKEIKIKKNLKDVTTNDTTDENFSIKLAEKKVFFTSAKLAYAARAHQAHQSKDMQMPMEKILKHAKRDIEENEDKDIQYFRQNRSAASEYATQKMIEASTKALEKAKKDGDTLSAAFICSGLYALEEEIKTYGEKYATAVRAFAIIDSMDKALVKVNTTVAALQSTNSTNLDEVNREIETLSKELKRSIEEVRVKHEPSKERFKYSRYLILDADYVKKNILKPVLEFIDALLEERFFGWVNPEYKQEDIDKISKEIERTLEEYTDAFLQKRQALLEKLRDAFIADVKSAIQRNGGITDEAKAFILAIDAPEIKPFSGHTEEFGAIYDANKCTEKILWMFDMTGIKKADFMRDVKEKLIKIATDMSDGFVDDFEAALQDVKDETIKEFTHNKERYSRLMRAMLADKKAMTQLGEKIAAAALDLKVCQEELETTIWREKK